MKVPDPPFWREFNAPADWVMLKLFPGYEHTTAHNCALCDTLRVYIWLLCLQLLVTSAALIFQAVVP